MKSRKIIILLTLIFGALAIGFLVGNNQDNKTILTGEVTSPTKIIESDISKESASKVEEPKAYLEPEEIIKEEPSRPRAITIKKYYSKEINKEIKENVEETPSEPKITDPYDKEYETFEIIKTGAPNGQAVFLYKLSPENLGFRADGNIINFHPEKTYMGYDELGIFLEESGIEILIIYMPDMNSSENQIKTIRQELGISMIVRFAQGARAQTAGVKDPEPLPFNF